MEVECTKRGVHFFVDKPISVQHPDQMRKDGYVDSMDKAEKSGLIISVGYMFRYSRAVSRIKEELIKHFGGTCFFGSNFSIIPSCYTDSSSLC